MKITEVVCFFIWHEFVWFTIQSDSTKETGITCPDEVGIITNRYIYRTYWKAECCNYFADRIRIVFLLICLYKYIKGIPPLQANMRNVL